MPSPGAKVSILTKNRRLAEELSEGRQREPSASRRIKMFHVEPSEQGGLWRNLPEAFG